MDTVIQTQNLTKKYRNNFALDKVNINVTKGDVYGLIGRNGAGKTTFMKIINRQIIPSSGSFTIQGKDVTKSDRSDLRIGTLIEAPGLYPDLTAHKNLKLKCQLFGIHRPGYIEELLKIVGLDNVKGKKVKKFSLGMKQRLGLAIALVGDPDILLLDEPTNGMDPQGIAEFRETILKLNRERNITIMISSHILGELAKFVNKIGIIHHGQLIKESSTEALDTENQDHLTLISQDLPQVVTFLEEKLNIHNYTTVSDREVHIFEYLADPEIIIHPLIKSGILFEQFYLERFSLEDYFIQLTGGDHHA